jgi:hypothetical protein
MRMRSSIQLCFLIAVSTAGLLVGVQPTLVSANEHRIMAKEALVYVKEHGILPDTFKGPAFEAGTITRLDFTLAVIDHFYAGENFNGCFRNIAPSQPVTYTHLFRDVPITAPYAKQLCVGIHVGLIDGKADGSFRLDEPITVAEASKVLAKAYGIVYPPTYFSGKPWYQAPMLAMRQHGALYPTYPGPKALLAPGQLAMMVYGLSKHPRYPPLRVIALEPSEELPMTLALSEIPQSLCVQGCVTRTDVPAHEPESSQEQEEPKPADSAPSENLVTNPQGDHPLPLEEPEPQRPARVSRRTLLEHMQKKQQQRVDALEESGPSG